MKARLEWLVFASLAVLAAAGFVAGAYAHEVAVLTAPPVHQVVIGIVPMADDASVSSLVESRSRVKLDGDLGVVVVIAFIGLVVIARRREPLRG